MKKILLTIFAILLILLIPSVYSADNQNISFQTGATSSGVTAVQASSFNVSKWSDGDDTTYYSNSNYAPEGGQSQSIEFDCSIINCYITNLTIVGRSSQATGTVKFRNATTGVWFTYLVINPFGNDDRHAIHYINISTGEETGTGMGVSGVNLSFSVNSDVQMTEIGVINGTNISLDTTRPTFASASVNITIPQLNDVVGTGQIVQDETALSTYRFADNRTGTFVNSSAFSISETSVNATFNFTNSLTRGNVIGFKYHVTDNAGNTNETEISTVTVANIAPSQPTILFPTDTLTTNLQPMDINITFPADADSDAITIFYYINDTLNQTSSTNVTFNASDGVYTLDVSIFDGFDSSSNASLSFNIDTVNPIILINEPQNNSLHRLSVPVDLLCTDSNPFLLNYTFFQADTIFNSEQNGTPTGDELTIVSSIDTSARTSGNYGFNVSCSDVHTRKKIGDYNPNKDKTNKKVTFSPNTNDIEIQLIDSPVGYIFSDITAIKKKDRYSFDFGASVTRGLYKFKITSSTEPLIYLQDSEFDGHFVTSRNWIDFENDDTSAIYSVTKINDYSYFVSMTTDSLNFDSIGGLNIVESSLDLEIDNTAPGVTAVLNNNTPEIPAIIQYNTSCTDANGISSVSAEVNTSGSFVNITTDFGLNATPFGLIINHTAVNGTFAFRSTCEDAVGNSIQSGLTTYVSHAPTVDTQNPVIDSTAIQNATPQEDDVIGINATCTDAFTGLSNITVENNATLTTFTNVSTSFYNNDTTATFEFNHTVVFGFIAHRFTCTDGVGNSAQSALVNYNSTEAPVITAEVIFPLESVGNVIGMLALFLIIMGLIFGGKALAGKK
jgi:uncharacterized protein YxeA